MVGHEDGDGRELLVTVAHEADGGRDLLVIVVHEGDDVAVSCPAGGVTERGLCSTAHETRNGDEEGM